MRLRGIVIALVAVAALAAGAGEANAQTTSTNATPSVTQTTSSSVSSITYRSAVVHGTVTPADVSCKFEWGTTTAYLGTPVPCKSSGTSRSATLSGLPAETVIHFRVVTTTGDPTVDVGGGDQTFTTAVAPPTETAITVTPVSPTSAQLSVGIDPHGHDTQVVFVYQQASSAPSTYGSTTSVQDAGAGRGSVTIRQTLTGLMPGKAYQVRAQATNSGGTTRSANKSVTTQSPLVTTGPATGLTPRAAVLTGNATPRGMATQGYYEWGLTTTYGNKTTPANVGAGIKSVAFNAPIFSLKPGTTYHFRVDALTSDGTVTHGKDRTFKTTSRPVFAALSAAKATVAYDHGTTISGTVSGAGAAGATIRVFANPYPFAGAQPFTAFHASPTGAYRFQTGKLLGTTRFSAKLNAAGVAGAAKSVKVSVRPSVRWSIAKVSKRRLRISGTVQPSGAATIYLRKVGANATVTVRSTRGHEAAGSTRTFAFTVATPRAPAVYRIRVVEVARALVPFTTAPRTVTGR